MVWHISGVCVWYNSIASQLAHYPCMYFFLANSVMEHNTFEWQEQHVRAMQRPVQTRPTKRYHDAYINDEIVNSVRHCPTRAMLTDPRPVEGYRVPTPMWTCKAWRRLSDWEVKKA